MFKTLDKQLPLGWGEQGRKASPWGVVFALAVVGFLVLCSLIPYDPEIALAGAGIAIAVMVFRQSGKPGT